MEMHGEGPEERSQTPPGHIEVYKKNIDSLYFFIKNAI